MQQLCVKRPDHLNLQKMYQQAPSRNLEEACDNQQHSPYNRMEVQAVV
jgi:hypothetical protein